MIRLEALTKRFGPTVVVDRVSLEVDRGELLVLVGGSGSGKTTTLKMVNRLVEPSSGRVLIGGSDAAEGAAWRLRRRIGYVFQQVGLFPHLTVAENIAVTPRLEGWPEAKIAARVDELLELVQLAPARFRERLPARLSGGEQQRVGLARALAVRPEVVLLDEPFGGLDPLTRDRLQAELGKIRRELGFTGIFVTHDMSEALRLGDRVAVIREGRLAQVGTPAELVQRPADDYVAGLMATPRRQAEVFDRLAGRGPEGEA